MLTADHVDARKTKEGELVLRALDHDARIDGLTVANAYLDILREHVGKRREEIEEAFDGCVSDELTAKRFKLCAGLRKLVLDECELEAETEIDPTELRRVLFLKASEVRRSLTDVDPPFDREAVIAAAAKDLRVEPHIVERGMFSDLRGEQILRTLPTLDAESLVDAWELGQTQAILLTAVRVTCDVFSRSAGLVRAFFAKLKFHKLLFKATRLHDDGTKAIHGWRVEIDGPYSMFDAVTKYGLRLALAWPALRDLERWTLVADVRWGKARESLVFRAASLPPSESATSPKSDPHISDDVRELMTAIEASGEWSVREASVVLDVPGMGVCIPDLELTRISDGSSKGKKKGKKSSSSSSHSAIEPSKSIYVEVLGYWSRDAVFHRVEMAEKGLGAPVIFAVSSRLRVSEEILDESLSPSSLYVYKGKISPRAILERAAKLADGE